MRRRFPIIPGPSPPAGKSCFSGHIESRLLRRFSCPHDRAKALAARLLLSASRKGVTRQSHFSLRTQARKAILLSAPAFCPLSQRACFSRKERRLLANSLYGNAGKQGRSIIVIANHHFPQPCFCVYRYSSSETSANPRIDFQPREWYNNIYRRNP